MKKIRIVHILHSFGTGGLEKGISMLVRNASPRFEHIILSLTEAGDSVRLLPPKTKVISLGKKEGNSPLFIFKLANTLKFLKPDVVHTRNWSGMDGIIAAHLAGISNIVHGEHGWGIEDISGVKYKRVMLRRLLSFGVREYTCVSRQMVGWLNTRIRIRKNRITQIYNGIDCGNFRPTTAIEKRQIKEALGIGLDQPVIGIVGRLDPIKDHLSLLDAFSKVTAKIPEAVLLVVGDGPERKNLERVAGKNTFFLGNRSDAPIIFAALDVFVLTSLNEGISNTILEAMATALPVVATHVGGTPEIVENEKTGMLVLPKDISAITRGIKTYLYNPALGRQHGRAGREKVMRNYSITKMVSEYERVWTRVSGY
jgi:sugar transferase (PEP-CTERM/EpsH1 system associated)